MTVPPESRAIEGGRPVYPGARVSFARLRPGLSAGRVLARRPEFIVTLFTGLHLTVTFLNQVVLAYLFGVSTAMDAFWAAGALPLTIMSLLVGELGFVLVPLLTHHRDAGEELSEISSRLFSLLALGGLGISLLGVAGHGWILRLTTSSEIPSATLSLAIRLAPWLWLLVGLNFVASFFIGLYHFYRRFMLPAVVLSFPYLGMMVGGLGWARTAGIESVVFGWLAGTLLKMLVLAGGIWKPSGLRFPRGVRHPVNRQLWTSLVPLSFALMPFILIPVLDVFWASGLPPGSLSALGYASRIVFALTALVVQGIAVVLFPAIAADGAAGEREEFRRKVSGAIQTILLIVVPLAAVTAALRVPLLELLFERGSFDRADTLTVARVLPWYLLGLLGMAPMNVISRGFFALRNYKTPAALGLLSLLLYATLSGILIRSFSYVGIAVAFAVSWPLTFLLQAHVLGRAVGKLLDKKVFALLVKVGTSSLLAATVVGSLVDWLSPVVGILGGVVFSGLGGLLLIAGLSTFVFKVSQLRVLWAAGGER